MFFIQKCPVPTNSLLAKYPANGAYADAYWTEIAGQISLPEFIHAFYTTSLFRLERSILAWTVSKPSTDRQAEQVADGSTDTFAAWQVEDRREHEILLCDISGRTRSWLMVTPVKAASTRLYFGSAVVPVPDPRTGMQSLGFIFKSLLGFHRLYSVLLLYSAAKDIKRKLSKDHGS